MASPRSLRGLDLLSFFVAGIQAGFGPFIAILLTTQHWTQTEIGFAFSIGGIVGLIGQVPGGLLIDALRHKRRAAGWSIAAIAGAAMLLVTLPTHAPVFLALIVQSLASCVLGPAIAAICLAAVGHAMLSERLGRNARFASIGNGIAAAVMGALGTLVSDRIVFWLTAVLAIPALYSLHVIGRLPPARGSAERALPSKTELRQMLTNRGLVVFAMACLFFHLANAAMVPLAATDATRRAGEFAGILVGVAVVAPQIVVALISVWIGRTAEQRGRRVVLLLGWGMLPVRGVALALLPSPWLLPAVQAFGGISDAVFAIMMPLVAADLTRGTQRLNLCVGIMGLMMVLGATLSVTVAGGIADRLGDMTAFLSLAATGLVGLLLVWFEMPETKGEDQARMPASPVLQPDHPV